MYEIYKSARNMSWMVLYESGMDQLPIRLKKIADYYDIKILSYTAEDDEKISEDGYSLNYDGRYYIYYNKDKPIPRIRFTIAHELGHILLNHLPAGSESRHRNFQSDKNLNYLEIQANIFARDLLMPAIVLHNLNVTTIKEIIEYCNVSQQSAAIRLNRLQILNKRNKFNLNPLEKKVYNQFLPYIEKECKLRNSLHSKKEDY